MPGHTNPLFFSLGAWKRHGRELLHACGEDPGEVILQPAQVGGIHRADRDESYLQVFRHDDTTGVIISFYHGRIPRAALTTFRAERTRSCADDRSYTEP